MCLNRDKNFLACFHATLYTNTCMVVVKVIYLSVLQTVIMAAQGDVGRTHYPVSKIESVPACLAGFWGSLSTLRWADIVIFVGILL